MPAFVRVIVDHSPDREFDYAVPETLASSIVIGSRVRLPFREKDTLGTVVGLLDESDIENIRPITALVGEQNAVRPKLIELARWMADYYACPVETAMRSVLPQVIRKADVGFRQQIAIELAREVSPLELESLRKKAPRQADALEAVGDAPILLTELAKKAGVSEATIKTLVEKGFLKTRIAIRQRDPNDGETFIHSGALVLSPEQEKVHAAVVDTLETPLEKKPILLHGVTGSGKTEIYLRAIQHTLDQGKSAIVLVPEISLTPQTTERFRERFNQAGHQVAVLHSHLSSGERHDEWHKIASGAARIVIGARSAVFAPVSDLGLIVIDEEHEHSYKQEESPRYQARDVAIVRAKLENCAILLGSATPSLESYRNCLSGKYRLLQLLQRVDDKKMPRIQIVDMREESRRHSKKDGGSPLLSEKLKTAIGSRLEKREQTILFLNRRGYSTSLVCNACGHVVHCPNCSVPLTFHRSSNRLNCHICGQIEVPPKVCPECRDPGIRQQGAGTEKIEEAVARIFPKSIVRRMDADSMTKKDAFRETLNAFRTGKIDILVGTQMIAKGLHFPNVTLVGIINADSALHLPDFRAGERTFQLITQVAGRAGRGDVEGEVFVQSHTPFHPCIQFARHHDFAGFQEQELDFRQKCDYPPFTHMILVTVRSPHELRASFSAETLARRLAENLPEGTILGQSAPAPMERLKGFYRFHIILRAHHILRASRHIRDVISRLTFPEDVIVTTDVDPFQLL